MKPNMFTPEQVIKAIQDGKGIQSAAAKILGCGRQTITNYKKKYASVREACEIADEAMIDFTEQQLFKNIQGGKEASIFFYLKTKAKHRGYIERVGTQNLNVDMNSLNDSQLKRLADGEELFTILADKG